MKRKEISGLIRKYSPNECECKECAICLSQANVQNHHLIKVCDLKEIAWKHDFSEEDIKHMYMPRVNLCKSCHQSAHSLYGDRDDKPNFTEDEAFAFLSLMCQIDLSQVNPDYYMDYVDTVDDMVRDVLYNTAVYYDLDTETLEAISEIFEDQELFGGVTYDIERE